MQPNPWSRLEAVNQVRRELGWLRELLDEGDGTVAADDVRDVVRGLEEDLHDALNGDLATVLRVTRLQRFALVAEWRDRLGIPPL